MRITSFAIFNQITRSLNENMRLLSKHSQRLSSGKKINKPSDDTDGMMKSMDYKVSISDLRQFDKNIGEAENHLGFADTVMSSAGNALTRARELAMQGSTGSQSANSRAAIAQEIGIIRDEVLQLANSKFRNRYIFSGYQTDTPPFTSGPGFTYQGDAGKINVITDRNATMAINLTGDTVFGSGATSIMGTLDSLYNDLMNDNQTGIQAAITDIDAAMDQVANVRADIGARLNHLDKLKGTLDERVLTLSTYLSETEDADFAETISEVAKTEVALQSLRQSGAEIMSHSLLEFLR